MKGRRSAYHRIGRMASHPAFSLAHGQLVCPVGGCPLRFDRVGEYTPHLLGHDPDEETAFQYLDAHTYDRQAPVRGWRAADVLLTRYGEVR